MDCNHQFFNHLKSFIIQLRIHSFTHTFKHSWLGLCTLTGALWGLVSCSRTLWQAKQKGWRLKPPTFWLVDLLLCLPSHNNSCGDVQLWYHSFLTFTSHLTLFPQNPFCLHWYEILWVRRMQVGDVLQLLRTERNIFSLRYHKLKEAAVRQWDSRVGRMLLLG